MPGFSEDEDRGNSGAVWSEVVADAFERGEGIEGALADLLAIEEPPGCAVIYDPKLISQRACANRQPVDDQPSKLSDAARSVVRNTFKAAEAVERAADRVRPGQVPERIALLMKGRRIVLEDYRRAVDGEVVTRRVTAELMIMATVRLPHLCDLGPECKAAARPQSAADEAGVRLDDFHAYMPSHQYIWAPARDFWPAASVNARIQPLPQLGADGRQKVGDDGKPKFISAAAWLDQNRPVEQMTWAPGFPMVIRDRLVSDGGWMVRPGVACFNLYRPPAVETGDPELAGPWVEHLKRVYPDDAEHIALWLAHRVQRPGEKINHALVLGGSQGIGKDTILEPVKYAVGPWNFGEVEPGNILGRFNGFLKSVVLRISEARDQGEVDRYAFYDRTKIITAAPPDVLRVDEKHIREYAIFNVCGVIITTNHKSGGMHLEPDDRRHYVAWSELVRDAFEPGYWSELYGWYADGGLRHVASYLATMDLSDFDPKAPPPQTPAFWAIVDSSRGPEDAELADALDQLRWPPALTISQVMACASAEFRIWLQDRKNNRRIPHRFEGCGYEAVRNPAPDDGMWIVDGRRVKVYAKRDLSPRERIEAAQRLTGS